jgi:hypothetical protein
MAASMLRKNRDAIAVRQAREAFGNGTAPEAPDAA